MNRTVTTGVVTRISSKDGATGHMAIACPMLPGKNAKENVVVNYPSIEFNGKTTPTMVGKNFKVGDRVKVEGHVQSYLRKREDGTTAESMFIYADSVEMEKSKFEKVFDISGRIYDTQVNDVYLRGEITGVARRGTAYEIYMTPEDEEKNTVKLVYFRGNDSFGKEMSVGTKIAAVAMVQSIVSIAKNESKTNDYQRIVASDIIKLEE